MNYNIEMINLLSELYPIQPQLAFYKVDDDEVHIIRILYNRRNFMQVLFGKDYP